MGHNERVSNLENCKAALGQPYFENEHVILYHGDCRDFLGSMKEHGLQIPLTVTSPPYNIGKEYERVLPLDEYLDWCEGWIHDIWDVTEDDGAFWLNLGYVPVQGRGKAVPLPYMLWDRTPFFLVQEMVWHYEAGVAAKRSLSPRNEKWLWYVKDDRDYYFDLDAIRDPDVKYPNQKKNGVIKVNAIGKNPSDVWRIAKVTSGANRSSAERTSHPAQFPLQLVERLLKGFSRPGAVVMDPFMGSGTVGEAAMRYGRRAIGFELNEEYLEFAARRLIAVQQDLDALLPVAVDG